jgi:polyhydroxyalkanoate synthase
LRAYQSAEPPARARTAPAIATFEGARLEDHGGSGRPIVLVPSLINPPDILDLDPEVSLCRAIAEMGRRAFLIDWGPANSRKNLDVAGHIEHRLLPLLRSLDEPPVLIGYCLGGTMAIAASHHIELEGLVTLAAPWNFSAYSPSAIASLEEIWSKAKPIAEQIGALPMEVLQAAFWSLDPLRVVRKFARFAALDPNGDEARRFVTLEMWANGGEPIPFPAARELFERLFRDNESGEGRWNVAGEPVRPDLTLKQLHCIATGDRIVPEQSAPPGPAQPFDSGHVGMVVGSARAALWRALADFLALDART